MIQSGTLPSKLHKQGPVDLGGEQEKVVAGGFSSENGWLGRWKKKQSSSYESETSVVATNAGVVPDITIIPEEEDESNNKLEREKLEHPSVLVGTLSAGSSVFEEDMFESDAENKTSTSSV